MAAQTPPWPFGVAVTYDTREARYNVYTAETVAALLTSLREADLVIGFNTRDFDYQVLQPYTDVPLATLPTLAVLDEVQRDTWFSSQPQTSRQRNVGS